MPPPTRETPRNVLRRFVSRTKLLSGRWPCPYCGRQGPDYPRLQITIYKCTNPNANSTFPDPEYHGCWYCNLEDLIGAAEKVLSRSEEAD